MTSILCLPRVQYDLEAMLPRFGFAVEEMPTLQRNYEVACQIAKCEKPHMCEM